MTATISDHQAVTEMLAENGFCPDGQDGHYREVWHHVDGQVKALYGRAIGGWELTLIRATPDTDEGDRLVRNSDAEFELNEAVRVTEALGVIRAVTGWTG